MSDMSQVPLRVFIIRPWHDQKASLYPHVMDGIEYVDAVIRTIRKTLSKDRFDVRVDEDVFRPGLALSDNVQDEISNADVALAVLDGLRPNVIFELGLAHGLGKSGIAPKAIIGIVEKDATVLVRNYYPDPMAVPTNDGTTKTIFNPSINISKIFSDYSGMVLLYYDRLNLDDTLGKKLARIAEDWAPSAKRQVVDEGTGGAAEEAEAKDAPQEPPYSLYWTWYAQGDYGRVIENVPSPVHPEELRVLALCHMKLGNLGQASRLWEVLLKQGYRQASARFHLGICLYALGDLSSAYYYFEAADTARYGDAAKTWKDRTRKKLEGLELDAGTCTDPETEASE